MTEYTFSRFAYFDTNILSHLAKDRHLWPRLFEFFRDNDLTLGLSGAQFVELSDADRLHQNLIALFMNVPSALLKTWDMVVSEEVKAHPRRRTDSLLLMPVNQLLLEPDGIQKIREFLSSGGLRDARRRQLEYAQQMPNRLAELKNNFPPTQGGKYVWEQAGLFADMQVMQWLSEDHREFLEGFKNDIKSFHPEVFLSVRLYAQGIFYKYYVDQREPKKRSDFGDLGHLFLIPYCELAVMDRELCDVLHQIQRHHDTLASTAIRNIDFFVDWVRR